MCFNKSYITDLVGAYGASANDAALDARFNNNTKTNDTLISKIADKIAYGEMIMGGPWCPEFRFAAIQLADSIQEYNK